VEKQLFAIKRYGRLLHEADQGRTSHHLGVHSGEIDQQLRYFIWSGIRSPPLNHTQLKRRLVDELDRARRIGNPMSFVMIDLDHSRA
jgi:hypothetical protein